MRALAVVIGIAAGLMRMRRMIVAVLTIMRVAMAALPGILMMPERHALTGRNRCQPLDRDGQGQQRDNEKSEEEPRHRRAFYANVSSDPYTRSSIPGHKR